MMSFYIYRHIRPDKNEVFYIGKGNNISSLNYSRKDWRHKRNNLWQKIVNKNNGVFISEIIFECETEEEVNRKEAEFILIYGRINIKTGTLANLTDGGDGCVGMKHSKETLAKLSISAKNRKTPNPFLGKKHSENTKKLLSKMRSDKPNKPKDKFINVNTGEVLYGIVAAAKSINLNKTSLSRAIRNNYERNTTSIVRYKDFVSNKFQANKRRKRIKNRCKPVIDTVTNEVFESVKDASLKYGLDVYTLRRRLNGIFNNNTNLEYYNE